MAKCNSNNQLLNVH